MLPKIEKATFVDHDVFWFDVVMYDPEFMQGFDTKYLETTKRLGVLWDHA